MFDEDGAKPAPVFEIGQNLESLSVEELSEIIELLKGEISRLEDAKQAKSAHLDAAAALFGKKS